MILADQWDCLKEMNGAGEVLTSSAMPNTAPCNYFDWRNCQLGAEDAVLLLRIPPKMVQRAY